jgi:hypothetical protein
MHSSRSFGISALYVIFCCFYFSTASLADGPAITGEFPFEDVAEIYSGPFTRPDRDDLLVLHSDGGIVFGNRESRASSATYNLAIYSFDGTGFQRKWLGRAALMPYAAVLIKHGRPGDMVSGTPWCFGDFDRDGIYSIVTCTVNEIWERHLIKPNDGRGAIGGKWIRQINTPDIWIDQMIGCDIDDDGRDEIVAMQFPNNPDSCCKYHVGIYKIDGDSLFQVWRGLDGMAGNSGVFPPQKFISKCRVTGIPGEIPIIVGPQSDMSLSSYIGIGMTASGVYDIVRPFPRPHGGLPPPRMVDRNNPDERRRMEEEMDAYRKTDVGPVGGIIINDGNRVLHYGYFHDGNSTDPNRWMTDRYSFSLLHDEKWNRLGKEDPLVGGLLTKFTIESGKSGWLFINNGKFSFYDKLPVAY